MDWKMPQDSNYLLAWVAYATLVSVLPVPKAISLIHNSMASPCSASNPGNSTSSSESDVPMVQSSFFIEMFIMLPDFLSATL